MGVINFTIESTNIHINALCVPNAGSGIGKELITKVILFSKENKINIIKLVCYGNVHKYYEKLGFDVKSTREVSDGDSDSDSDSDTGDNNTLTEYKMSMNVNDAVDFEKTYFDDDEDAVISPNTNDFEPNEVEKGGKNMEKIWKKVIKPRKIIKARKKIIKARK